VTFCFSRRTLLHGISIILRRRFQSVHTSPYYFLLPLTSSAIDKYNTSFCPSLALLKILRLSIDSLQSLREKRWSDRSRYISLEFPPAPRPVRVRYRQYHIFFHPFQLATRVSMVLDNSISNFVSSNFLKTCSLEGQTFFARNPILNSPTANTDSTPALLLPSSGLQSISTNEHGK